MRNFRLFIKLGILSLLLYASHIIPYAKKILKPLHKFGITLTKRGNNSSTVCS